MLQQAKPLPRSTSFLVSAHGLFQSSASAAACKTAERHNKKYIEISLLMAWWELFNYSASTSSVPRSALNQTEQGSGHYEHSHRLVTTFPHNIFYHCEVQCQPPAGRIVNINRQLVIFNHWVYLPQHHETSRKSLRHTLIPVPGKRLHFKTECWFWALRLSTRKNENWQKLSRLGVYIWRIYQLPMNLC